MCARKAWRHGRPGGPPDLRRATQLGVPELGAHKELLATRSRQKGTGRARHGSIRSPLWIGGGVTHGPTKDRNYKKALPKNIKRKALFMVLSEKQRQGLLIIVPSFDIKEPKTKIAREFLKNSGIKDSCLVVLPAMDKNVILSMRNMEKIGTVQAKDLNCLDVLTYKYLLTTDEGIKEIKKTFLGE